MYKNISRILLFYTALDHIFLNTLSLFYIQSTLVNPDLLKPKEKSSLVQSPVNLAYSWLIMTLNISVRNKFKNEST